MTGEDTSALQAVLAADPERMELLAEEARLMAALNQDGTSAGHAHTNGGFLITISISRGLQGTEQGAWQGNIHLCAAAHHACMGALCTYSAPQHCLDRCKPLA